MTTDGKFNVKHASTVKIPTINTAMEAITIPVSGPSFGSISNIVGLYYNNSNLYLLNAQSNTIYFSSFNDPLNVVPRYSATSSGGYFNNTYSTLIGDYFYAYGANDGLGDPVNGNIFKAYKDTPLSWINTGISSASASNYAMIYVDGSNIYLLGGLNSGFTYLNTIDVASLSTPTTFVTSGNTLPAARVASAIATIGSNIYLYGGSPNGSTSTNTIYIAATSDPTTWTTSGNSVPRPIYGAVTYTDGVNVYLYGGTDSTAGPANLNTIYTAPVGTPDVLTLSGSTLPVTMTGARVFVSGNYIYMLGSGGSGILRASTSDPLTWTQLTNYTLPTAEMSSHVLVDSNKVYSIGGFTTAGTGTTTIQSASTNFPTVWTTESNTLPAGLGGGQLVKTKSFYYIIGANGTTGSYYSATLADPTTWTLVDTTGPTRPYGQAMFIDDQLWYFGGESNSTPTPVTTGWRAIIQNGQIASWVINPGGANQAFLLPIQLTRYSLVRAGDYVYVIGGITSGPAMNSVIYRAQKNRIVSKSGFTTWLNVGSISHPMASASQAIINNRLYLIGGGPTTSLTTTDDYVLSADMSELANGIANFTEENTATVSLAEAQSICVKDDLYLIGGRTATNGTTTILKNVSWATHNLVLPKAPESSDSLPTLDLKTGTLGSYSSFQRTGILPWKITDK